MQGRQTGKLSTKIQCHGAHIRVMWTYQSCSRISHSSSSSDYNKAFDSVGQPKVSEALKQQAIGPRYTKISGMLHTTASDKDTPP